MPAALSKEEREKIKRIEEIYAEFLRALDELRSEHHQAIMQLVKNLDTQELARTKQLITSLSSEE